MATRRWRQDPGLPADKWNVEQRNGWFYATPKPKKAKATKPAAKKKLPPLEFLGDPTLAGSYKKPPALNPDDYVTQQGRDGRYYAVRRTELTGLDPDSKRLVKDFDTTTAGQAARIGDVGNAQADAAAASAARDRQALADYARNTGVVVNPSDPTAAAVARAMGQSNAAAGGPEVVRGLDMPTVLRAAGATNVERYRAQRASDRAGMLTNIRNSIAQAEADRQKAAADLRGQNLQLLASLSGQDASTQRALLSGQVQLSGQQAANQRAQIQAQTSIRNTDANISSRERIAAAKAAQDKKAAALKKKGRSAETYRMWADQARKMAEGIPFTAVDADGKSKPDAFVYNYYEVVKWLTAAGATPQEARRIAKNTPRLERPVLGPPAPGQG